jgi:hypothetical protein
MLLIKGITEAKADKFYEAAAKIESNTFCTGIELMEKRKSVKALTTGSKAFDLLLSKFV